MFIYYFLQYYIYIKIDLSFFKIRYLQRIKQQKNDLFLFSFEAFILYFREYNERNSKQKSNSESEKTSKR